VRESGERAQRRPDGIPDRIRGRLGPVPTTAIARPGRSPIDTRCTDPAVPVNPITVSAAASPGNPSISAG